MSVTDGRSHIGSETPTPSIDAQGLRSQESPVMHGDYCPKRRRVIQDMVTTFSGLLVMLCGILALWRSPSTA